MQRTYDQLSQDLCINNNPATILVNTASVYGMNDVTHLGLYDITMISNIPNMVYLAPTSKEEYFAMLNWSIEQNEHSVAIIALRDFYQLGENVIEELKNKIGLNATLINPQYITGIDSELLKKLRENHSIVITLEDGCIDGGFGEKIASFYGTDNIKVKNYGIKKDFYDKYDVNELLKANRLTKEQIVEDIKNMI